MALRLIFLLPFLLSCGTAMVKEDGGVAAFKVALEKARAEPETAFTLEVHCTDDKGQRSLVLFDSGAALWNEEAQIRVDEETRLALLNELLEADFATFEGSYGGKPRADAADAAVKVLCSIDVHAAGLEKLSYQDVNGERSPEFMALASNILDRMEPLAAKAIRVGSLEQGLIAVAKGTLVAETLFLKMIYFPEDKKRPGTMVEAENGQFAIREFQPGAEPGDSVSWQLEDSDLQALVNALVDASYWELPRRLHSSVLVQIHVRVLQHEHAVMARSAFSKPTGGAGERQLSFDRLVETLLSLEPEEGAATP